MKIDDNVHEASYDVMKVHALEKIDSFADLRFRLEPLRRYIRLHAHDINNYVTGFQGESELALMEDPVPSVRESLQAILKTCGEFSGVLQETLVFAGGLGADVAPLSAEELWVQVLARLRKVSKEGQVALVSELRDTKRAQFPAGLDEAVFELCVNGLQAGTSEPVQVEVREREEDFVLWVHDRGSGMDSHTQQRCWEPFYSTDSARRGLGLAKVFGLMAKFGGKVGVASMLGVGTVVALWLPKGWEVLPRARRQAILDESTWDEFHQRLEYLDYQVFHARGAREALLLLERFPKAILVTRDEELAAEQSQRSLLQSGPPAQLFEELRVWTPERSASRPS